MNYRPGLVGNALPAECNSATHTGPDRLDNGDIRFKEYRLDSAFQPIFSFAAAQPVGYEALVRASTAAGEPVSPAVLFGEAKGEQEHLLLDRLCRCVHLNRFSQLDDGDAWLFLNVDPQVVINGPRHTPFFERLLDHYHFDPTRVVVEIVENAIGSEEDLADAVAYYRELGCLIAVDDFGSGHSNINRIWQLRPDIVKLDRSLAEQALLRPEIRRSLDKLVGLLHDAGSLVLMEGVEREEQAMLGIRANVDLLQGYLFGRPSKSLCDKQDESRLSPPGVCEEYSSRMPNGQPVETALGKIHTLFRHAAERLLTLPLEAACEPLLRLPHIARCYLLDYKGRQQGANLVGLQYARRDDPRFRPLSRVERPSWLQRDYFQNAINQPGLLHTSAPYLSLTGYHFCVTLSFAVNVGGRAQVLCCDVDWQSLSECHPETDFSLFRGPQH